MVAEKSSLNNIHCHFSYAFITTMEKQLVCLGEEIIGEKCFKNSSSQSLGPFLALQTISVRTPQAECRDVACSLLSTCTAVLLLLIVEQFYDSMISTCQPLP